MKYGAIEKPHIFFNIIETKCKHFKNNLLLSYIQQSKEFNYKRRTEKWQNQN